MSHPSSVIFIGAGELGSTVLRALARHPARGDHKIGVLLRQSTITNDNPAKKYRIRKLLSLNLSFEAGDIEKDSADELAMVLKSYDVVIIGYSGMEGTSGVQLKLTKAAISAGVKRYIPWQFGVDYDVLGRESSRDIFDEQPDDFVGVVSRNQKTVRALGSWENAVIVTDIEDIGKMTAEVAWNGDGIRNEVVLIAGDTISYGRLAKVVEETQASPLEKMHWRVPYLKENLAKDAENSIKKYRVVFAQGKGVSWDLLKTLNFKRGIQPQTVTQWRKH